MRQLAINKDQIFLILVILTFTTEYFQNALRVSGVTGARGLVFTGVLQPGRRGGRFKEQLHKRCSRRRRSNEGASLKIYETMEEPNFRTATSPNIFFGLPFKW